jgi:hypothetical protein
VDSAKPEATPSELDRYRDRVGNVPFLTACWSQRVDSTLLAKALWLGYLKVTRIDDPLINAYVAWCHAAAKTAVLLYPCQQHFSAITYQIPLGSSDLTEQATTSIRERARSIQTHKRNHVLIVTPSGGEITGLRPDKAEELAFWIGDAVRNSEQLERC